MKGGAWLPLSLLLAACGAAPGERAGPGWDPGAEARIVTQHRLPSQCVSPVAVYKIDGRLVSVSPQGFTLDAGRHELEAQGLVNTTGCPLITRTGDFILPPLEHGFRAGATYYLGVDHSAPRFEDWRLRIWKIECASGVDCLGDAAALADAPLQ